VNVDLAPVADVPNTRDNFLGSRAFSSQRSQVLRASCAFARGLRDGGVMPTLKHFPGLGGAGPRNTDRTVTRIGMTVPRLRRDAVAYSRCGSEPGTLAMVSNAIYPKLTGRRPAVLAAATYAFARRLGERGPFVTDSLDAAGLAGQRAVATRAVIAGANLLLYTVPGSAAAGYRELVSAQTRGVIDDALLAARAAPVRELRASIRAAGP
jgi:beta-N-acetylhexosaminidase